MRTSRNSGWPGRFFLGLSIILLSFSCFGTSSAGSDGRTVTVGVYENAPKIFTTQSGQPAGIFIDVIEHIARIEGWRLVYVSGTWVEGLDRLEKGKIDLMPDVAFTVDRARIYAFHKIPVLSSWFQVYAPKGNGIQSILDLNGKRILVLERSVQQEAFVRLSKGFELECTLISVQDYKTMFEMVAKGQADAAITNRFYGLMHAKQFGLEETSVVFEPSDLFFAAPKDFRRIAGHSGQASFGPEKDHRSAYYESLKRWTSEEVRFKLPAWLKTVGMLLGLFLLASLAGSLVLKQQVNARTRELKQTNQRWNSALKNARRNSPP